jgi:hypothetical protein
MSDNLFNFQREFLHLKRSFFVLATAPQLLSHKYSQHPNMPEDN